MTSRKDAPPHLYGGQAVIEGVMIRGRNGISLAVRAPDGSIRRRKIDLPSWSRTHLRRYPGVRGLIVLAETLILGAKTLNLSARIAAGETEDQHEGRLTQAISGLTLLVSFAIGIGLFLLLPLWLSNLVENAGATAIASNIVEGVIRLVIFGVYIWGIGFIKDIRRMFGYHGAEHMTIAASEAGEPLVAEKIRNYPKEHPRCGTSFLVTVAVVSVVIFSLVPREPFWLLISSRIFLIPVIAAVSYELIRLAGVHSAQRWVRLLASPNLLAQKLTTRPPDDSMIEVAIDAMRGALEIDGNLAEEVAVQEGAAEA